MSEDILSGTQFKHQYWERYSRGSTLKGLEVVAEHPKFGRVGEMHLSIDPDEHGNREIHDVGVLFQRRGIGTGLYNHAVEAGLNPVHSPKRTEAGDAWAHKVGGVIPPRNDWRERQ